MGCRVETRSRDSTATSWCGVCLSADARISWRVLQAPGLKDLKGVILIIVMTCANVSSRTAPCILENNQTIRGIDFHQSPVRFWQARGSGVEGLEGRDLDHCNDLHPHPSKNCTIHIPLVENSQALRGI